MRWMLYNFTWNIHELLQIMLVGLCCIDRSNEMPLLLYSLWTCHMTEQREIFFGVLGLIASNTVVFIIMAAHDHHSVKSQTRQLFVQLLRRQKITAHHYKLYVRRIHRRPLDFTHRVPVMQKAYLYHRMPSHEYYSYVVALVSYFPFNCEPLGNSA